MPQQPCSAWLDPFSNLAEDLANSCYGLRLQHSPLPRARAAEPAVRLARPEDLGHVEALELLADLGNACGGPDFQNDLLSLLSRKMDISETRKEMAKLLGEAWKDPIKRSGFAINGRGFHNVLKAIRMHMDEPDVREATWEVELRLCVPQGGLFGAAQDSGDAGSLEGSGKEDDPTADHSAQQGEDGEYREQEDCTAEEEEDHRIQEEEQQKKEDMAKEEEEELRAREQQRRINQEEPEEEKEPQPQRAKQEEEERLSRAKAEEERLRRAKEEEHRKAREKEEEEKRLRRAKLEEEERRRRAKEEEERLRRAKEEEDRRAREEEEERQRRAKEEEERLRRAKEEEDRRAREEEEERQRRAKEEEERLHRAKEEEDRRAREEEEERQRKAKEEEERLRRVKEEEERLCRAKEEEDRKAREEEEERQRKAKEEEERLRRATEEEERLRRAKEEEDRRAREEEEERQRRAKEEEERLRRAKEEEDRRAREEDEEERQRKAKEEEERLRRAKEEEDRRSREEEEEQERQRRAKEEEESLRRATEEEDRRARQQEEEDRLRRAKEEEEEEEEEERVRRAEEEEQSRRAEEEEQRRVEEEAHCKAKEEVERRARDEERRAKGEEEQRRARVEEEQKALQEDRTTAVEEERRLRDEKAEGQTVSNEVECKTAEDEMGLTAQRNLNEEAGLRAQEEEVDRKTTRRKAKGRINEEVECKAVSEAEHKASEEAGKEPKRKTKDKEERKANKEARRRAKEEGHTATGAVDGTDAAEAALSKAALESAPKEELPPKAEESQVLSVNASAEDPAEAERQEAERRARRAERRARRLAEQGAEGEEEAERRAKRRAERKAKKAAEAAAQAEGHAVGEAQPPASTEGAVPAEGLRAAPIPATGSSASVPAQSSELDELKLRDDGTPAVAALLREPVEHEVVSKEPVGVQSEPAASAREIGQLQPGSRVVGLPCGGWLRLEKGGEPCLPAELEGNWVFVGSHLAARCLRIAVVSQFAEAVSVRWPGLPAANVDYTVECRAARGSPDGVEAAHSGRFRGSSVVVRTPEATVGGIPPGTEVQLQVVARVFEENGSQVAARLFGAWAEAASGPPLAEELEECQEASVDAKGIERGACLDSKCFRFIRDMSALPGEDKSWLCARCGHPADSHTEGPEDASDIPSSATSSYVVELTGAQVFSQRRTDADILGVLARGEIIRGRREGLWLRLTETPPRWSAGQGLPPAWVPVDGSRLGLNHRLTPHAQARYRPPGGSASQAN